MEKLEGKISFAFFYGKNFLILNVLNQSSWIQHAMKIYKPWEASIYKFDNRVFVTPTTISMRYSMWKLLSLKVFQIGAM